MKSQTRRKFEVVNADMLHRELHSRNFLSGLESAIQITLDTARETSFKVRKQMFKSQFEYPEWIIIGSENSVGNTPEGENIGYLYAKQKFFDETGLVPDNEENRNKLIEFMLKKCHTAVKYPDGMLLELLQVIQYLMFILIQVGMFFLLKMI